jgi:hypothetical protein
MMKKYLFYSFRGFFAALTAIAAFILVVGPAPADATIVGGSYDFTATGFPSGAPYATVTGSFTISFDNSTDIVGSFNSTNGLSAFSVSGPFITLGARYDYYQSLDRLVIGDFTFGVEGILVSGPSADFILSISNFSTNPTFLSFNYATNSTIGSFGSSSGTLAPISTPEPTTMLLLGFGIISLAGLRRKA